MGYQGNVKHYIGIKSLYSLLVASILVVSTSVHASDDDYKGPGLIDHMRNFQYFSHKLGLAVQADNKQLADFYAHEVEETAEAVEEIEEFDGYPVGALVKSILLPALEDFEQTLETGTTETRMAAYQELLDSCNKCHQSAGHPYIHIRFNDNNPYNQSFEVE